MCVWNEKLSVYGDFNDDYTRGVHIHVHTYVYV